MITSLENKTVKELTKLHQKKYRTDRFLLSDNQLIQTAAQTGYLQLLVYCDELPFSFPNVLEVSREVLDKIAGRKGLSFLGVSGMIKEKDDYRERVILLDRLQDPLNIGRIMEAAQLFGFDSIVLSPDCADICNEKCLNACKGGIYRLNICHRDLPEEVYRLKQEGFSVYATGLRDNTRELHELKNAGKMAFILGNEGNGVSRELLDAADGILKIDMCNIDSLNVGMAAAIIMHRFQPFQ